MTFQDVLNWVEERETLPSHRQILVLSGVQDHCQQLAWDIWSQLPPKNQGTWIGESPHLGDDAIAIKHYQKCLGQDYHLVVYNAFSGLLPNAFLALQGCLSANGLLIVLTPSLDVWGKQPDAIQQGWLSFGHTVQHSAMNAYLADHFLMSKDIARFDESGVGNLPIATAVTYPSKEVTPFRSEDQKSAFNQLVDWDKSAPVLLSAKRGRGKSTLLGFYIAQQLSQGQSINLYSTSRQSVEHLFIGACQYLPTLQRRENQLYHPQTNSVCQWYAIDNANINPLAQITIVDEAAAINTRVLSSLIRGKSACILSTTTDGYEGSRAGYRLKFIPKLTIQYPNIQTLTLSTPLRWHHDDWLENWSENVFGLSQRVEHITAACTHYHFSWLDASTLLDENKDCCHLLAAAHYQTSPDDIARIANSPDVKLIKMTSDTILVGVAVIIEEGGEAFNDLADDIAAGARRPIGHLGAQSLATITGDRNFVTQRSWRINRIAIHPSIQGLGLGSALLKAITLQAHRNKIDYITTSFAYNEQVAKFWLQSGFITVRDGKKHDAASGAVSTLMIYGLTTPQWLDALSKLDSGQLNHKDYQNLPTQVQVQIADCLNKRRDNFLAGKRNILHLGFARIWILYESGDFHTLSEELRALARPDFDIDQFKVTFNYPGRKAALKALTDKLTQLLKVR